MNEKKYIKSGAGFVVSLLMLSLGAVVLSSTDAVAVRYTLTNDLPVTKSGTTYAGRPATDDTKFPAAARLYTAIAIKPGYVIDWRGNRIDFDYDLQVFSDFDPTTWHPYNQVGESTRFERALDVFILDGTARASNRDYYARIYPFNGTWGADYDVESDYQYELTVGTTINANFRTVSGVVELIDMYTVKLYAGGKYTITFTGSSPRYRFNLYYGNSALEAYIINGTSGTRTFYPQQTGYYGILVTNAQNKDEETVAGTYSLLVSADFELSVRPTSHLIAPGMSASYNITVSSLGIVSNIDMNASWYMSTPAGTTLSQPSDIQPAGVEVHYTYVNVTTTASTPDGTYRIYVAGDDSSNGPAYHYLLLTLVVSSSPSFTVASAQPHQITYPGDATIYNIDVYTINNFNADVTLSATVSPAEPTINCSFAPNPVNASGGWKSNLTVATNIGGTTPIGDYTITISGIGGALSSTTTVRLSVHPGMPVTIAAPTQNEIIRDTYTFRVFATSSMGVIGVAFSFGGVLAGLGTVQALNNSGVWEYTVNTNSFPDGWASLTAIATDTGGGRRIAGPRWFNVDNTAPNPQITRPQAYSYVKGRFEINVTVDSSVNMVMFKIDTASWIMMNRVAGGQYVWNYTWDSTTVSDGNHALTVRARDYLGRDGDTVITIAVDNNPPTGGIRVPTAGAYVSGTTTFRVAATDTVGVDRVNLTITGPGYNTTVIAVYNAQTGDYEYTLNTLTLSDGSYMLNVTMFDRADNSGSIAPVSFNIDNNAPSMVLVSPLEKSYVGTNRSLLVVNASDIFMLKVEYRLDDTNWVTMTGTQPLWQSYWDTTVFRDGPHTLHVRAFDNASHITEQSIIIYVDNTRPSCAIVSPASNQFVGGVWTFRVAAGDANGIDHVDITVYTGTPYETTFRASYNTQTSLYELTLDTTVMPNGDVAEDNERNVSAVAYDLAGKASMPAGPIKFRVDNHPPELRIISPVNHAYVPQNISQPEIQILTEVRDKFVGPVHYRIDDGGWVPIVIPWNTSRYTDGEHKISVKATDLAGHETLQTIMVFVDNTPPTAMIIAPRENECVEGILTFVISAADSVGLEAVTIHVFNTTIRIMNPAASGKYEYSVDTRTIADGVYEAIAFAHDLSGKTTAAGRLQFKVDNNAPDIKINSPQNGAYVRGTVQLDVTVTDVFLRSVKYNLDDGGNFENITVPIDTALLSDGQHKITITAIDEIGHTTVRSIIVIVNNIAPQVFFMSPPADRTAINGVYRVQVSTTGAVQKMLLRIDNLPPIQIYSPGMNQPYEYMLDTRALTDGIHTLVVSTTDFTNRLTTRNITVIVDNTGPKIVFVSPSAVAERTVQFVVNLTDLTGVESVKLNIDGTGWRDMVRLGWNWSYTWHTTEADNGLHSYEVKAFDVLGNERTNYRVVQIKNPTDYWALYQSNIAGISFIFVILFLILLFLLIRFGIAQRWVKQEKRPKKEKGRRRWRIRIMRKPTPEQPPSPSAKEPEKTLIDSVRDISITDEKVSKTK